MVVGSICPLPAQVLPSFQFSAKFPSNNKSDPCEVAPTTGVFNFLSFEVLQWLRSALICSFWQICCHKTWHLSCCIPSSSPSNFYIPISHPYNNTTTSEQANCSVIYNDPYVCLNIPVVRINFKCFLDVQLCKIQISKLNISLGSPIQGLDISAVNLQHLV